MAARKEILMRTNETQQASPSEAQVKRPRRGAMRAASVLLTLSCLMGFIGVGSANAAVKPYRGTVICNHAGTTSGWVQATTVISGRPGEVGYVRIIMDQLFVDSLGRYFWKTAKDWGWIKKPITAASVAAQTVNFYDLFPTTKQYVRFRMWVWDGAKSAAISPAYFSRFLINGPLSLQAYSYCQF
jgi:hypothetical protein